MWPQLTARDAGKHNLPLCARRGNRIGEHLADLWHGTVWINEVWYIHKQGPYAAIKNEAVEDLMN